MTYSWSQSWFTVVGAIPRPPMLSKSPHFAAARSPKSYSPRVMRRSAWVILVVMFAVGQTVLSGVSEGYCIVWPGIGTHFAPGFSHLGFARIRPGMTQERVRALLGEPLGKQVARRILGRSVPGASPLEQGDEAWNYSGDSGRLGGDWAWLSRQVVFRDGVVTQKVKWTYHD